MTFALAPLSSVPTVSGPERSATSATKPSCAKHTRSKSCAFSAKEIDFCRWCSSASKLPFSFSIAALINSIWLRSASLMPRGVSTDSMIDEDRSASPSSASSSARSKRVPSGSRRSSDRGTESSASRKRPTARRLCAAAIDFIGLPRAIEGRLFASRAQKWKSNL